MLIGRRREGAKSSLPPETDKLPAALTEMRHPLRLGRRALAQPRHISPEYGVELRHEGSRHEGSTQVSMLQTGDALIELSDVWG